MKRKLLADHKQEGKRFIPPLMQIPNMQLANWKRDSVPELLWIGLLVEGLGLYPASEYVDAFLDTVQNITVQKRAEWFFASTLLELTTEQQTAIMIELEKEHALSALRFHLAPLSLYSNCPLSFIFEGSRSSIGGEENRLKKVVATMQDRFSILSTHVLTIAFRAALNSGKMQFMQGIQIPNLNAIVDYPGTEESKSAAAFIRSDYGAMFGMTFGKETEWDKLFWDQNRSLSKCI